MSKDVKPIVEAVCFVDFNQSYWQSVCCKSNFTHSLLQKAPPCAILDIQALKIILKLIPDKSAVMGPRDTIRLQYDAAPTPKTCASQSENSLQLDAHTIIFSILGYLTQKATTHMHTCFQSVTAVTISLPWNSSAQAYSSATRISCAKVATDTSVTVYTSRSRMACGFSISPGFHRRPERKLLLL
jgi:hypothetical protein